MATPQPETNLTGRRILVCRPEPDAQRLARYLTVAGAEVRVLPMLERLALAESPWQRTVIQNLDQFNHVIAVSPYAARLLLERVDTWWPQFPIGLHWYGVGSATARVFQQAGLTPMMPDAGFTSEALLQLPDLQSLQQETVLLARGEDGRELIRDTLQQRGARVTELSLYQRRRPDYSQGVIDEALHHFDPDVVITLSGETLNNFIALGENTDHNLKQRMLVVPVERVANEARSAGFRTVCVPAGLGDDAIATAIANALAARGQHGVT